MEKNVLCIGKTLVGPSLVCRPGKGVQFKKVQKESDRSLERPEYRRNQVEQKFSVLLILDTSPQNIHFRLVHALHTEN